MKGYNSCFVLRRNNIKVIVSIQVFVFVILPVSFERVSTVKGQHINMGQTFFLKYVVSVEEKKIFAQFSLVICHPTGREKYLGGDKGEEKKNI